VTRAVWAWVRMLGGVSIIAVLVWRLGSGAFLNGLRIIDGGDLLVAFLIGVTTTVFSAWRWCLVARGLGMRLTLREAVAEYYKALFLNAALPGGVLGDVDRAVQHGRGEGDVGRGVRAVVLERTAGQIVLVSVGLIVLLTVPSPVLTELSRHGVAAGGTAATLAVVAVLALVVWGRLRRGTSKVASAARTGVAEIRSGLLARRNWPGIVLASAVVLFGHLATFVVAARAAGSTASLLRLAPLMLLALLAMSLPVNIGGWGPREGVTAWAFGAAGLSASQGLTIAVAYGLFAFIAALPGAIVVVSRALSRLKAKRIARLAPISPAVVAVVPAQAAGLAVFPAQVAGLAVVPAQRGGGAAVSAQRGGFEPVSGAKPAPVPLPYPAVRALAHQGA
jgi:uncharacterized membrane protein YbhN (UPF0104 family)